MANLRTGKIYKIVSDQTDKVFIGSTEKKNIPNILKKDWKVGRGQTKSKGEILKFKDAKAILLEELQFNTIDELHARICYYINAHDTAVNKVLPGISKSKRKEEWAKLKAKQKEEIRQFDEFWMNAK